MEKGYCKKCEKETEFEFVSELMGMKKFKCKECDNVQLS